MPNLGLTAAEVDALITYLASQAAGAPATKPKPPSALPRGDPARGKNLFTGAARFENEGPPCLSCHTIAGIGRLGGGTLGPDLTRSYTKYGGDAGIAGLLETLPFPTMTPLFADKQLAAEDYGIKGRNLDGRPFNQLKNYVWSQLEFAAQVSLRFHRWLEESMGPAAGGLRRIHREIGALEQPEQVGTVTRRDGNADAGVTAEAVAEAIERRSQRPIDLRDQRLDVGVADDVALQDGELIAAEPCNKVARSDGFKQASRDAPQELVADQMAQ